MFITIKLHSGQSPFPDNLQPTTIHMRVFRGVRPKKPNKMCETSWKVVAQCFLQDPFSRPTAGQIVESLQQFANTS